MKKIFIQKNNIKLSIDNSKKIILSFSVAGLLLAVMFIIAVNKPFCQHRKAFKRTFCKL